MILWGENSAYEYGGDDEKELKGVRLTPEWFRKYGVTHGTRAEDWVGSGLTLRQLAPYRFPNPQELRAHPVQAVFLGQFFPWDPRQTYQIARRLGFQAAKKPKTGLYNFADVDDSFLITLHHWMKWYKFGFTRLWDNLSQEIRRGRLSRGEAIRQIQRRGEEFPGTEITQFCRYTGVSLRHFLRTAQKFRNRKIWKQDIQGRWMLKNGLIPGRPRQKEGKP